MSDAADAGTPPLAERYRHSGRLGAGAFLVPLTALLAPLALGYVYAYANVYVALDKLHALAAMAYGAALGFLVFWVAKKSKCRNNIFVAAMGLLAGLAGVYAAWAGFIPVLFGKVNVPNPPSYFDCLLSPVALWETVCEIADVGWFTYHKRTVKDVELWFFWACEAATIVLIATVLAYWLARDLVFCERCLRWCEEQADAARASLPPEALLPELKTGDLRELAERQPPAEPLTPYARIDLNMCRQCNNTGTYKIVLVEPATDKKKEKTKASCPFLMTPANAPLLGKLLARKNAPPAGGLANVATTATPPPPTAN